MPKIIAGSREWEAKGRELQLLIDGSPASFALQNISAGGVMGDTAAVLRGGSVCLNRLARLLSGASAGFMPLREAVG